MKLDIDSIKRARLALLTEARAIADKADGESRDLTDDEKRDSDAKIAEADALEVRITREEELARREGRFASPGPAAGKPGGDGTIGMGDDDLSRYSLIRAIRAAASGDWAEAGLEREASQAVAKQSGREPRGFFVPRDFLVKREQREQRDMVKGTSGAGGYVVGTDLLASSFIDLLRNKMVVRQAGATVLDGLVGDITIPRQSAGATAYWVAESVAPTESQQTLQQVALLPKSLGAFTDISRKLLLQSSIDVEALVRNDLATILAIEIDRAALHGSGSGAQPTGIDHTSGIGAPVDYSSIGLVPTWAHIVALETSIATSNADTGRLAYITSPKVRGKLKGIANIATYGTVFIWLDGSNQLNGYPAYVTSQVSNTLTAGSSTSVCSAVFFGNWGDLLIGMWGGLDILVDPYTGGTTGTVRIIAFQDVDIGVRHPESFAALLGVLAA